MSLPRADQLRDLGRLNEAAAAYAEVLVGDPENGDARVGHGLTMAALKAFDTAIGEFSRVLEHTPGRTDARYHRAVTYSLMSRDDEALADLNRLLAEGFREWYVWSDRGALALRNGFVEQAVTDQLEAERLAPAEPAVQLNLGCALMTADRPAKAFAHLAAAADAGFTDAVRIREAARRQLALRMEPAEVQAAVDELSAAASPKDVARLANRRPPLLAPEILAAVETAARERPNAAQPVLQRRVEDLRRLASAVAATELTGGREQPAWRSLSTDPVNEPDGAARYKRLIERRNLLHQRGNYRDAAALAPEVGELALRVYGRRSTEFGLHLVNLAIIEASDAAWDLAESAMSAAVDILVEIDPGLLPDGLVSYAALLSNAGHSEQSLAVYELAVAIVQHIPESVDHSIVARTYRGFGEALVEAGAPAEAETVLATAVDDPMFSADGAQDSLAAVLNTLAQAVFAQGRHAEAVELCQRVLQLSRELHGDLHRTVAMATRGLGRTYWAAGNVTEALTWLTRSASTWEQLAGAATDPAELALTQSDLALLYARAGAPVEARAFAYRTRETLAALASGANRHAPYVLDQLRQTFRLLGDLDGELDAQLQVISEARRLPPGEPASDQMTTLADIYYRLRRFDEASRWYSAALDATLATTPDDDKVIAILRHNLANVLAETGQTRAALEMHEGALTAFRRALDPADPQLLQMLLELAEYYYDDHQPADAERLLAEAQPHLDADARLQQRAEVLARQLAGDGASQSEQISEATYYGPLIQEALAAIANGADERGAALLEQALPIALDAVGPQHPVIAMVKHNLAVARRRLGVVVGVAELFRDALDIRLTTLSLGDERITNTRLELAELLRVQGHETEATELATQVLQTDGADQRPHLMGRAHTIIGLIAHKRDDLTAAEPHLRTAMLLADRTGDEGNRVTSRRNLILSLLDLGRFSEADEMATEALELCTEHLGSDDIRTADAALSQAKVLRAQGRYAECEPLIRQTLTGLERLDLPDTNHTLRDAYNELGLSLCGQNQPQRAEPWFWRALAGAATTGQYPTLVLNQAHVYADLGYPQRARSLVSAAVEALAEQVGTDDPRYGRALGQLGDIEVQCDQRHVGTQHLVKAHNILKAACGAEHPNLLEPLSALAGVYLTIGARRTARSFARSAATIARRTYGERHPGLAPHLVLLARCEAMHGDTAEAMRLSVAAVDLTPTSISALRWLGWLQAALGARAEALATFGRVSALQDTQLYDVLGVASEGHRTALIAQLWQSVDEFLTVALADADDGAPSTMIARHAWELVVRRRGINAEYLRLQRAVIYDSARPDLASNLRELAGVRAELARAAYTDDTAQAQRLTARREELEQLLAMRVGTADLGAGPGPVDTTQLAAAVPPDTTYIEYVRSTVSDFANLALGKRPAALSDDDPLQPRRRQRYVAFVLGGTGEVTVRMVDLGDADPIDRHSRELRAHLTPAGQPGASLLRAVQRDTHGDVLRRALFDPLHSLLDPGRHRLLIVTDGAVGQVPLQVLPVGGGRRLIDDHPIAYLTSARDLRRRARSAPYPVSPPLILADPDYDLGAAASAGTGIFAQPLPATRDEAREIGALLAVEPLTGPAAVKIALEETRSPLLVHLATHGLFLPTPEPPAPTNYYPTLYVLDVPGEGAYPIQVDRADPPAGPDVTGLPGADSDPLLRSAVALAGFNAWLSGATPPSGAGNGLLTADEVCALDLRDTRIVVLSACDTGLGDRLPGESVVGLRWAFAVAGAWTVVSSLWQVPDRATQELMVEFYRRLLDGDPVPDAMRAAQLHVRQRHPDPFLWGAFVCHGDPRVVLR